VRVGIVGFLGVTGMGSSSVVQQDEEACVGSEAMLSELEEQQPAWENGRSKIPQGRIQPFHSSIPIALMSPTLYRLEI
jgi:hypothetical protein